MAGWGEEAVAVAHPWYSSSGSSACRLASLHRRTMLSSICSVSSAAPRPAARPAPSAAAASASTSGASCPGGDGRKVTPGGNSLIASACGTVRRGGLAWQARRRADACRAVVAWWWGRAPAARRA